MPVLLYASAVKVNRDGFSLSLNAAYTLRAGEDISKTIKAKGRLPNIDVLPCGNIVLSVSGISNGQTVPAPVMARATPFKHLVTYLKSAGHIRLAFDSQG